MSRQLFVYFILLTRGYFPTRAVRSRTVRLRAVRLRAAAAGARTAALVERVVLLVFGQGGDDLLLGRPAIPSSGAEAANTELGCTLT